MKRPLFREGRDNYKNGIMWLYGTNDSIRVQKRLRGISNIKRTIFFRRRDFSNQHSTSMYVISVTF